MSLSPSRWSCRLVQLVLCTDSPQTDVLKLYCWDDPTPRTACYNDDPSACMFSYSWSVTPVVIAASPTIGMSGDVLTLQGNAFDDVTAVWLTAPWGSVSCPVVDVYSTNLTCTIPDMPAGQYRVRLMVCTWLPARAYLAFLDRRQILTEPASRRPQP